MQEVRVRHLRLVMGSGGTEETSETSVRKWGLDEAYRTYANYTTSLALRILGNRAEAEEVTQDVFLAAAHGLQELRDPDSLRGWLGTITVRKARYRLRRRKLRQWVAPKERNQDAELAGSSLSPEQQTLLRQLYQVLDTLPVQERLAWTLRHVEGEKLERVAALCGCSLATAKRRIAAVQDVLAEVVHG